MKTIIIQSEESFLFVAEVTPNHDLTGRSILDLPRTRCIIRQRTGRGVEGFATDGPSADCKLSQVAAMPAVHRVVNVYGVTEAAAEKIWAHE